ncbi:hypothetical protein [Crocosphaera sp.]|uniref:hypothetical protein n=1 Tax=Crocosphaera sp. TaxID=2729996 RepID=UPI003F28FFFD|nr:hypothetical protein [Crocosphaera sp.]
MIERLLLPVDRLSQEKEEMFSLLESHFIGVTRRQFEEDLSSKNWVILLREEQVLKGFSTLEFYETKFKEESVRIVYSGDTITDPSIWSSPALAQAWIQAIQTLHQESSKKLYWLLISSGYRTYRFLSICWQRFYPHYNDETSPEMLDFIHHVAQAKFQQYYTLSQGIVRFPKPQTLRSHLGEIPPEKFKDPHVAFFLKKNPNHGQGDELVCLTEVSKANLTKAGLRLWNSKQELSRPFALTYS